MTLTERIETCQRLIELYRLELSGLRSIEANIPDFSNAIQDEGLRAAYQRGREEGLNILTKGEGL